MRYIPDVEGRNNSKFFDFDPDKNKTFDSVYLEKWQTNVVAGGKTRHCF
jgi:hypothetical protein